MSWNSLEQMTEELDLKSNPKDIDKLKAELKARIKELHPDNSGGNFKSEDDAKNLYRLIEALDYCDVKRNTLIPLDSVTELIKQLSENLASANKEPIEARINRISLESQAHIGQRFRVPKISLGAISAILTYIFFSPEQLMNHPFLGDFIKAHFNVFNWLLIVYLLSSLWFVTWMSESNMKAHTSKLFSLEYHREILNEFKHSGDVLFSRTQLQKKLLSFEKRHFFPFFLRFPLDSDTNDKATNLAIERYLERKWIRLSSGKNINKDIDDWYEIII